MGGQEVPPGRWIQFARSCQQIICAGPGWRVSAAFCCLKDFACLHHPTDIARRGWPVPCEPKSFVCLVYSSMVLSVCFLHDECPHACGPTMTQSARLLWVILICKIPSSIRHSAVLLLTFYVLRSSLSSASPSILWPYSKAAMIRAVLLPACCCQHAALRLVFPG